MKHQQGAALVIVMALLAGAMTLGLSGMQTALVDERLAGNYRAATQARMNAEIAAAIAMEDDDLDFLSLEDSLTDLKSMSWAELIEKFSDDEQTVNYGCDREGQPECVYIPVSVDGSSVSYVLAKGIVGEGQRGGAESNTILLEYEMSGETVTPFSSAVTSCEDITLKGGASISGSLVAGNEIDIKGGASVSSSQQQGYDFSEGCDSLGVLADDEEDRSYFERIQSGLNVVNVAQWLEQRGRDHYFNENDNAFTFTGGKGNQDASVSYIGKAGSETSLRIDKDLKTSGRLQSLVIDGTVNLFVDGDFDLGGNTSLEISQDAVLNLYVSGKVTLSAGSQLALGTDSFMRQDSNGVERPAVSVYSDYQDSGNGVTISGGNETYAAIYAPGSNVEISGGGALYGGLRAQNVGMSGGSRLEYVNALADYEVNIGGQGSGEPRFNGWTEVQ
ncbi:hypothetical protein HXW73_15035 [Halomonas sp. SH5A2]|uniref:pilus assembly PilX family protein n=1 Tax=Halomonas sp. SH5A2 TaxID=2749040 RepID=UPI00163E6B6C|nr:hypothetical protein [Halomonas sp. SH5A2]QNI04137.1 hypothetical protein HXW73_15035 [Halomonas sp. SH5A2]